MNIDTVVNGSRTHDDDLWVQAGNDIVLFDLLQRQEITEAKLQRLPDDHIDREYLEKFAFALKLGIAGHTIESSISTRPVRHERGRSLDAATTFLLKQQ